MPSEIINYHYHPRQLPTVNLSNHPNLHHHRILQLKNLLFNHHNNNNMLKKLLRSINGFNHHLVRLYKVHLVFKLTLQHRHHHPRPPHHHHQRLLHLQQPVQKVKQHYHRVGVFHRRFFSLFRVVQYLHWMTIICKYWSSTKGSKIKCIRRTNKIINLTIFPSLSSIKVQISHIFDETMNSSRITTRGESFFVTAAIDVEKMLFTFQGRHRLLLTSVIYSNAQKNFLYSSH